MILKRTSRDYQKKWLRENKNLKILDLGCSLNNYWSEANHFADLDDFSQEFGNLNLKFTQIKQNQKLPFKDKEFDYVILSHVLEHVPNLLEFVSEIERISKAGYIELPTKLNDNLVLVVMKMMLGTNGGLNLMMLKINYFIRKKLMF